MAYTYLEFEKPISDLENKIEKLRLSGGIEKDIETETSKLSSQIEKLTRTFTQTYLSGKKCKLLDILIGHIFLIILKIFFQILMSLWR